MQIDACLLCDSASDYQGKLCVLGAFDSLALPQVPAMLLHTALVLRIRFERSEQGNHPFRLTMIDADGKPIGPNLQGELHVLAPPPGIDTTVQNLILNMNGLPLPRYGSYEFNFVLDGRQVIAVPLNIISPPAHWKAA